MKYSQEEILKALHIIKDTCEERGDCEETCPFFHHDNCQITWTSPDDWQINDNSVALWKGLL